MMTKNTSEKLFTKFSERVRNGNLRIYEQWDKIVWEVDNPIEAQREDVVNWIRDVQKQSQMEIQSDESAIQSDGSLGSDVPAETIVYYT